MKCQFCRKHPIKSGFFGFFAGFCWEFFSAYWEFFSPMLSLNGSFSPFFCLKKPFLLGVFLRLLGVFLPQWWRFSPLLFRPPKSKKGLVGVKTTLIPFSSFKYFLSQIISGGIPIENFLAHSLSNASIFRLWTLLEFRYRIIHPTPKKRLQRLLRLLFLAEKNSLQHPPPLVSPGGL